MKKTRDKMKRRLRQHFTSTTSTTTTTTSTDINEITSTSITSKQYNNNNNILNQMLKYEQQQHEYYGDDDDAIEQHQPHHRHHQHHYHQYHYHHYHLPSLLMVMLQVLSLIICQASTTVTSITISDPNKVTSIPFGPPTTSSQQQQQQLQQQLISNSAHINQQQQKTRYRTMYACEDTILSIDCDQGSKINLIRANFGRFSITQCNEQGQLDLSTDCMSPITLRIMSHLCQSKQNCSVAASSQTFGDKCPKTRKYLEVHFQCLPDSMSRVNPPYPYPIPTIHIPPQQQPDVVDLRNTSQIPGLSQTTSQPNLYNSQGPSSTFSTSIFSPNNPPQPQPNQPSSTLEHQKMQPTLGGSGGVNPHHPSTTSITQTDDPLFSSEPNTIKNKLTFQQQPTPVMNSEILSYNSLYSPNNISSQDQNNIVVSLRHRHTENMSNPRCVLWDPIARNWTEKGSQLMETNSTHTTCAFDQATSYLLVMDYTAPYPTISQVNPMFMQQNTPQQPQNKPSILPTVPSTFEQSPYPNLLEIQPIPISSSSSPSGDLTSKQQQSQQQQQQQQAQEQSTSSVTSTVVKFFSLFGYLLAIAFVFVAFVTVAFIASSMRSSAGAALKSLGNFTAFSGGKYNKNARRTEAGQLHNKDLLVINNQNGHQFLYAPASTTKINNSTSTHILASGVHQQQQNGNGNLHQHQMYSTNGTLSNLSGTGGQSNNYYYGLMGLTPLFQQQQQQLQQHHHHLSQHHLNQQQQQHHASSYHQQANKSTVSTESSTQSTPSSSGVESGSTSIQQQQQQASCLMMNNDFNLMNHLSSTSNYGQHQQSLLSQQQQQQPTLTLNAHYSSSSSTNGGLNTTTTSSHNPVTAAQRLNLHISGLNQQHTQNAPLREHIYECVDDDKPYTARLLLPTTTTNMQMMMNHPSAMMIDQFNSNTLSHHHHHHHHQQQQQHLNSPTANRTMTLSTRLFQNSIQAQQQQQHQVGVQQNNNNKRMMHQAIVRDNIAPKTNIICSKLVQVTPQRATEINKFQHDMMASYNGNETTTTTTTSLASNNNSASSSSGYGRAESVGSTTTTTTAGVGGTKLSTDC